MQARLTVIWVTAIAAALLVWWFTVLRGAGTLPIGYAVATAVSFGAAALAPLAPLNVVSKIIMAVTGALVSLQLVGFAERGGDPTWIERAIQFALVGGALTLVCAAVGWVLRGRRMS